jgi:GT2 family glycosyltransferase
MPHLNLPYISVIVPTCHRNDLLAKCLDCLAPDIQSLPPEQYEVIVTDDGSRSTAEALVQGSYPWVRWVAGPRKGPAANRNNGAKSALGQWLAFTDDDCLPTPGWLRAYAQASEAESCRVLEGKTTCEAGFASPLYEAPINLKGGLLWSCNFMVQAGLFRAMGGLDEAFVHYMEDVDFRERLRLRGEGTCFVEGAAVDHPPRRSPPGYKQGQVFEARVQHWYKVPQTRSLLVSFLQHTKHQIYKLTQFPPSKDAVLAFLSLIVEAGYIATHLAGWQRKYRPRHL